MRVKCVYIPYSNGSMGSYEIGGVINGRTISSISVIPLENGLVKVTLYDEQKRYFRAFFTNQVIVDYKEMEEENYKDED